MREIWETPHGNAVLKIQRADKHIADIEQRLLSSSDSYGPSLHVDIETGEQSLDYYLSDRELSRDIALITGDAIHNLHCALDIAWCGVVRAIKRCKFPIYPDKTPEQLEATIKPTVPAHLVDFIVNQVKCHEGGDADILALHALDIDDKHRLLIPLLTVTGIQGVELQYPDGAIERLDIRIENRVNFFRKIVPLDSKLQDHGQVTFQVTFREGAPLENAEIISTLKRISWKASRIVRALEGMKL